MTVLVTGGAGGIGRAVARQLAASGQSVALCDLTQAEPEQAARELQMGRRLDIRGFAVDVTDRESVAKLVAVVSREIGPPRLVVTAAGTYHSGPLQTITQEQWSHTLAVNLTGTFNVVQACAKSQEEAGGGSVVMISSTGGKVGWPGNHAYCASKAGVIGLMRVLALELAPARVRVNAVCPGNTDTAMMVAVDHDVSSSAGRPDGWFKDELRHTIPLGGMARPDQVAAMVAFLCSDAADHVTGQAINVDGGSLPS